MEERTFGRWLRATRTQHKPRMSQELLAEITGIDRGYLSRIENDKVGLPLYETRQRIHAALGTNDDDLRAFGVDVRRDYSKASSDSGRITASESATIERPVSRHADEFELSTDDSPLTPEEEAKLANVMFTGFSTLTPRTLRDLIRVIEAAQPPKE